ncbi:MAG: DUF1501 domain-containing protein [Gemmataceae bacterium]|nr:DUF1501 domain-containing protein [Gemmataceae bacterium]NBS90343.1 DUF1501 domain-containing protein [bacterium]PHX64433.1 MAG: sulfatase [Planctomycetaceae bacterium]RLS54269.1 MAG: DUF1501 domain-containing protein [Planctomycetota bacterium]MBJ7345155.1 DUF1501 domain-containing protein [Gemmataceae bacterium]
MNNNFFKRRAFLKQSTGGLGAMALATLLQGNQAQGAASGGYKGVINPLHHNPKVKRVIYLYMAGGMSHLETWDPKPTLAKMHGQPMPESVTKGQQIAQLQGAKLNCFGPQHPFVKYGKSGIEFSSIFPELGARAADQMCIIRSMYTEAINHDPAHAFMNTGTMIPGKPSMGSWLWYGLGSDTENLPGFVVMVSTGKFGQSQPIAARQWHSGFLPSKFQGVQFRGTGEPVLYIRNPKGVDDARQSELIKSVQALDKLENEVVADPEIEARIAQYELAFRMQASVPELMDVSKEPKKVLEAYGANPGDGSFASNCLLARRLAERGVRFIQLYHRDWDHHGSVKDHSLGTAKEVDRGAAALIEDLKQRGMLDETLIVFGTEFGRTPMAQGNGRDHHIKGFSMWMAGGGIKGGMTYGNTDEFGYSAVEKPVPVHDIHATMLHLMGIDHKKLAFKFQGRDFRLTDVHGNVLNEILT